MINLNVIFCDILQFSSSDPSPQSGVPSHSGFTLLMHLLSLHLYVKSVQPTVKPKERRRKINPKLIQSISSHFSLALSHHLSICIAKLGLSVVPPVAFVQSCSSVPSPQSSVPSHFSFSETHLPFLHVICPDSHPPNTKSNRHV